MRIKKPVGHRETFFTIPTIANYRIIIVLTKDIAASVAYLAERDNFFADNDRVQDCLACHLHPKDRGHSYLVFGPNMAASSIAHECWHMIFNLMQFAGISLEDEFVAYHLGYAVQQVVDFQHKTLRRTKDAHSRRSSSKASTRRVRRSRGYSSKPKDQGSFGVHGAAKVRRS